MQRTLTVLVPGIGAGILTVAWVVSGACVIQISMEGPNRSLNVALVEGGVDLAYFHQEMQEDDAVVFEKLPWVDPRQTVRDELLAYRWRMAEAHVWLASGSRFRWDYDHTGAGLHDLRKLCLNIGFPLWFPVFLLMGLPCIAFVLRSARVRRRRKRGLCLKCAYDLTGNISGVCPECGTKIQES